MNRNSATERYAPHRASGIFKNTVPQQSLRSYGSDADLLSHKSSILLKISVIEVIISIIVVVAVICQI